MTNTYDEYADKAAARYLQGRMDEQAAWVEAVKGQRDRYKLASASAWARWSRCYRVPGAVGRERTQRAGIAAGFYTARAAALDALLRRMGVG